jgi:hypothetical protein
MAYAADYVGSKQVTPGMGHWVIVVVVAVGFVAAVSNQPEQQQQPQSHRSYCCRQHDHFLSDTHQHRTGDVVVAVIVIE